MSTPLNPAVRVREDAWRLPAGDDTLLWYARAVREMQSRPLTDPTSWRYQAAIHEYKKAEDPLRKPGDISPPDENLFWTQCQHFSGFFLPWHRMYLHCFEQIVAATVRQMKGPPTWSLPYWDYSDSSNPNALKLPPLFTDKLIDGKANPLRVTNRKDGWNDGLSRADEFDVDLACLDEKDFSVSASGAFFGFGGGITAFSHDDGGVAGALEGIPHGSMHVAVGGWMGSFNTAGLDPIFWLHHCNIDRLWEVWLQRSALFVNPSVSAWRDFQFQFHDGAGQVVTLTPAQVLDTTASPLGYRYANVQAPLAAQPPPPIAIAAAGMTKDLPAEMVGASLAAVQLSAAPTTAHVQLNAPTGPAFSIAAAGAASPKRVILKFENITGAGHPTSYAVYVNSPDDLEPDSTKEHFAGVLPMFGVKEASRAGDQHAGSGLTYALDVTRLKQKLQSVNAWHPDNLKITFVPRAHDNDVAPITVGRISVYYK